MGYGSWMFWREAREDYLVYNREDSSLSFQVKLITGLYLYLLGTTTREGEVHLFLEYSITGMHTVCMWDTGVWGR